MAKALLGQADWEEEKRRPNKSISLNGRAKGEESKGFVVIRIYILNISFSISFS